MVWVKENHSTERGAVSTGLAEIKPPEFQLLEHFGAADLLRM
jgi:hypothetical protein